MRHTCEEVIERIQREFAVLENLVLACQRKIGSGQCAARKPRTRGR